VSTVNPKAFKKISEDPRKGETRKETGGRAVNKGLKAFLKARESKRMLCRIQETRSKGPTKIGGENDEWGACKREALISSSLGS